MSCIGLHKLAVAIFGITQKELYITSSNLVTNKGIFLNLFCNLKNNWSLALAPFVFHNFVHFEGLGSKEKNKVSFLRLSDNPLTNLLFAKEFLECSGFFSLITKITKGSGTRF